MRSEIKIIKNNFDNANTQSIFINDPGAFKLLLTLLKLGKSNKHLLVHVLLAEEFQHLLINCPGIANEPVSLLEFGIANPILVVMAMDVQETLELRSLTSYISSKPGKYSWPDQFPCSATQN